MDRSMIWILWIIAITVNTSEAINTTAAASTTSNTTSTPPSRATSKISSAPSATTTNNNTLTPILTSTSTTSSTPLTTSNSSSAQSTKSTSNTTSTPLLTLTRNTNSTPSQTTTGNTSSAPSATMTSNTTFTPLLTSTSNTSSTQLLTSTSNTSYTPSPTTTSNTSTPSTTSNTTFTPSQTTTSNTSTAPTATSSTTSTPLSTSTSNTNSTLSETTTGNTSSATSATLTSNTTFTPLLTSTSDNSSTSLFTSTSNATSTQSATMTSNTSSAPSTTATNNTTLSPTTTSNTTSTPLSTSTSNTSSIQSQTTTSNTTSSPLLTSTSNTTSTPSQTTTSNITSALLLTPTSNTTFDPLLTSTSNTTSAPSRTATINTTYAPIPTATSNTTFVSPLTSTSNTTFAQSLTSISNTTSSPPITSANYTSFVPLLTSTSNTSSAPSATINTTFAPIPTTTSNTTFYTSPLKTNETTTLPRLPISTSGTATVEHTTFATPQVTTNAIITTTMLSVEEVNINVSIHSSAFTAEQKIGYINCSFKRNSTSNNLTTAWSKNGLKISNSSITEIYSSCNGLNCESKLKLLEVDILSKGEYKCDVQIEAPGVHYQGQAATNATVKQKPVLVIKPIRSSVMEGANVSVNCKVTNIKDAYFKNDTVIKMCFGNMTEVRGCHLNSNYDSTCNFVAVSTMTIECGLSNCLNNSITSTITAVSKADKLCETHNQWPSTQEGQEARIPCPDGYTGEVTRKCLHNGIWDTANTLENCTQTELKEIENVLKKAEKLTADILETSLSTISSILVVNNSISSSNENKFADNDIKQSVDLISTISKKNVNFTDQEAANKTTQVFMGIVSDILDTGKNKDTNKKDKEKEVTSKILESVNNFAKSVTSALKVNQTVTVKKPNMLLSIEKIEKNTDIKFPKETEDSSHQLQTHFILPQGAFKNMTGNEVAFTAVMYDNIGSEFISKNHTKVGSSVLSLTINGLNSQRLDKNITLSFQRKNGTSNSTDCVFLWKNNSDTHSVWNTSGCSLKNFTDFQVNCSCNHLTNFAILMSYTDVLHKEIPMEDIKRLKIISVFGCSLSIIGAFVTIVLYIYFWRYIKSRRSTLVINLCSALCIAYLLFLTAVEHSENKTGCIIIAALLHYFFLAMFTTMLCLGIDLAVAVFDVFSSRSRSFIFLLVSWGLPAVIVGITLGGSQLEGYGDETYCWLRHTTLFGFIVPVLCIVLVNSIIVIVVMRKIYTSSFMMKKSLKEKTLSGLRGICVLLPILGLTWVFGIFSVNQDLIIFQYLFAIFNSLQGLFIFLFYVALNPQMREAVARKIKIYDSRSSISKTSKTTKFVSTSYSEEEQEFSEREDGVVASNMYIIPRCSVQNKQFNKRQ